MARTVLGFELETDLISDAIAEFDRINRALMKRHGERFRALERQIELWAGRDLEDDPPGIEDLGRGRFVITPPAGMREIIAAGRALGL